MTKVHIHLASDSTGDTVRSIARACMVQFEGAEFTEHFWVLVRTTRQLDRVIHGIETNPGIVLCTILNEELRAALESACRRLHVPCIGVLDPVMGAFQHQLGTSSRRQPGRQHQMDVEYFTRIEAMNWVMAHDDGQSLRSLESADVVLVGVSRTSKTPTCVYLANRGIKAANVPVVPGIPTPPELLQLRKPLIVGLTVDPARLIQIRRNRLLMLQEDRETDYIDIERVREEVVEARRLFGHQSWPVIDVTRRSIEETAATIIQLYEARVGAEP